MSTEGYNQHISQQFNADLEAIRTQFLEMGGIVEQQVADAVSSLIETDIAIATEVIKIDQIVNRMERELDEHIARILALRQPTASDLRMVIGISKAITDMERIGDESVKIARIAHQLAEEGESPRGYVEARHIGTHVHQMIHDALDAFARMDIAMAFDVMQEDTSVDREYQSATRTLMTYMMEDPRYLGRVINVLWVLRSLERIGDHARNIAEQVFYMVKGTDVRHTAYDDIKQKIQ